MSIFKIFSIETLGSGCNKISVGLILIYLMKYQKYYLIYKKKTLKRLTVQANVQRRRPN